MEKKDRIKLSLSRVRIRVLSVPSLEAVGGGKPPPTSLRPGECTNTSEHAPNTCR